MASSNLPPGVTESDIPGNRPEDIIREREFNTLVEWLWNCGLEIEDIRFAVENEIERWTLRKYE